MHIIMHIYDSGEAPTRLHRSLDSAGNLLEREPKLFTVRPKDAGWSENMLTLKSMRGGHPTQDTAILLEGCSGSGVVKITVFRG